MMIFVKHCVDLCVTTAYFLMLLEILINCRSFILLNCMPLVIFAYFYHQFASQHRCPLLTKSFTHSVVSLLSFPS